MEGWRRRGERGVPRVVGGGSEQAFGGVEAGGSAARDEREPGGVACER